LPRFIARKKVIDELSVRGVIKNVQDDYKMILPRCSRTNDIIEYLLKEQWFVRCTTLARRAQKAVENGELKISSNNDGTYEQLWYNWLDNIR